ncbi:MAG: hypothetical protein JSV35_01855 [Candidatus Bathyarchaeota archaeon]|nr:MAG: hypothetical protein JSV35_01855 [Candidatus Bathyarchaeota archaeon]
MGKSRKLILAKTELIEEVAKIVAKEGRTLFSFTNEVFRAAIDAYTMDVSLADVLNFYRIMKIGKTLGFVAVPADVFQFMSMEIQKTNAQQLQEKWYQAGIWNGNYLSLKFPGQDPIKVLHNFIKTSLWNIDEFQIEETDGSIRVKCFSPKLSEGSTCMLVKFLEGVFDSYGFAVKNEKLLRGLIAMELKKKEDSRIPSTILMAEDLALNENLHR